MDPVQADDEGFEAGRRQMVHLVDGQEHPAVVGPGHLADLLEQTAEVAGQVARVGRPGHDLDVEEEGAAVGEGEGEGLEHPERPPVHTLHLLLAPQLEQGLAQRHGQAQGEPAIVAHLNVLVDVAAPCGRPRELVQQNRLPDAVQTREELAFPAPPDEQPLERHVELPDLRGPPGELVGTGARSRVVGVEHLVHRALYSSVSPL